MNKQKMISVLLIIVCIGLITQSGLFAQKLKKDGRFYVATIERKFDVKKGGSLVMEEVRGDVTIKTWDKKVVHINEIRKMDVLTETEAKAVLKDLKSVYKKSGNTITVGDKGSYRSYMSSKFTITVPKVFNVDVHTKGGDVAVSDLKGTAKLKTSGGDIDIVRIDGKVTAKTSGGDIEVENNKAKVVASTSGGDIELKNIGAEVEAHTSGGDIVVNGAKGDLKVSTSGGDVELKDIEDVIVAKTSGGDIEASNVKNGIKAKTSGGDIEMEEIHGFIEAATSGGDVEAEMTLKDFSRDHHVTMKSSGGNIILYIPEKLPATINAEIRLSGFTRENYNISSDFSINIKKEKDEKGGRRYDLIQGTGKINGGGDLIQLNTSNGNIEIRKLK